MVSFFTGPFAPAIMALTGYFYDFFKRPLCKQPSYNSYNPARVFGFTRMACFPALLTPCQFRIVMQTR